mgnify:CR=1 FL=1
MDYYLNMPYINNGSDGRIYGHNNIIVKKIINNSEQCDEVKLIQWLTKNKEYASMIPNVFWCGTIEDIPVIIREDTYDIIQKDGIIDNDTMYNINMALNNIWYYCKQYYLEQKNIDILNNSEEMILQLGVEHYITINMIEEMIKTYDFFYKNNIVIRDMDMKNLGLTQEGKMIFRDVGRFKILDNSPVHEEKIIDITYEQGLELIEETTEPLLKSSFSLG